MPREPPVTTATLSLSWRLSVRKFGVFKGLSFVLELDCGRCLSVALTSGGREFSGLIDEPREKRKRQRVSLPAEFRMPLNAEDKTIASRIFSGFDQTVTGPGGCHQFPAQSLDRLVMMAVDRCIKAAGEFIEHAAFQNPHAM